MKVLVAEDDRILRKLICHQLKAAGFGLIETDNGKSALELARAETPDIIILDQIMPVMDGIETVKHIREDANLRHIRILMLSNLSSAEEELNARKEGVDDYLTKPIDRDEMIASIRRLSQ